MILTGVLAHDAAAEIEALVDRETRAWDTQDVDLLLTIFHPDMVWPWPQTPRDHNPVDWVFVLGRHDRERWRKSWVELFKSHELVHNRRSIQKIVVSEDRDGAFAVVDIDTLWRDAEGNESHWLGRTCKIYTRVDAEWKMIAQTGALDYSELGA